MATNFPASADTFGLTPATGAAVPFDDYKRLQDAIAAIEAGLLTVNTYTPTWSGSTTNPTLGNGTLAARYLRAGKAVLLDIDLTIGSTTTFGAGAWGFSLPLAARDTLGQSMSVNILDAGTQFYTGTTYMFSTTVLYVAYQGDTGASISPTTPHTWAVGDKLRITGFYFLP